MNTESGGHALGPLPSDIVEAMVQCFGRAFHYKDAVASFLLACEVPEGGAIR